MVDRTVVGLIAEGYQSNWGGTSWLSDHTININGLVQVAIGVSPTAYLALDIAPRSKFLMLSQNAGNGSQNRRMGAGAVTEDGDFVGVGRAYPFTRSIPWRVIQRLSGVLSTLQTSINNAPSSTGPEYSRFFIDEENYVCILGNIGSEVLSGSHGLEGINFLPGCVYHNEIAPSAAGLCNLWNFNVHSDRYIYIYDETIPDGYHAWIVNDSDLRIGEPAVFADGVAIIDLMVDALITNPALWTKVAIYNGGVFVDDSDTIRVHGGDVFGVAPVPDPPNTPTITIDEITLISARLNGSIFASAGGNIHIASQWQVQLFGGDWSSLVIDTGLDLVNLLTYETGDILDENTFYEARVRYEDDTGLLSEWSNVAQFLTLTPVPEITSCDLVIPTTIPDSDPQDMPILLGEGCGEPVFPTIPEDELEGVIVTFKPCP